MTRDEHDEWVTATQQEVNSYNQNGTWELTPGQPRMEVIGSSWKFKLKRDQFGSVIKYKARLVARGDMQETNWTSICARTLRFTSLRVILALATYHEYKIE
jgi:hypothetical protein